MVSAKRFTTVRRLSILIYHRDVRVVSKRVCVDVLPMPAIRLRKGPQSMECQVPPKKVWFGQPLMHDEGKPIYVPGDKEIHFLPWLMHRRKDIWGPDGEFPFITLLLLRSRH